MEDYEVELLSLIGGIIVQWAHIEKRVWNGIHKIEQASGVPCTQLSKKKFAERKGILLRLAETHGTREMVCKANAVLRVVDSHASLRHGLAHDYVDVRNHGGSGPNILITNFGDQGAPPGKKKPSQIFKTAQELSVAYDDLKRARSDLWELECALAYEISHARPQNLEEGEGGVGA